MGGRRPKDLAGSGRIVTSITSTDDSIKNFAYAMTMLKPLYNWLKKIEKRKLILNRSERLRIATKEFNKIEKERKIDVPSDIRNMIIDSAAKALRTSPRG